MTEKRRVDQFGLLKKGDVVKLRGELGEFKVIWIDEFESVERPPEVTLIGGAAGRSAWRTVFISKIRPAKRTRKRRAK